jgi:membrane fusion protein (multidrug efflux system)
MLKRFILIVLVVGAVGGAMWALKQHKQATLAGMGRQQPPPATVSAASVTAGEWRQTLFAVGTLAAEQGIDVTVPLPGTLVGIHFESGQKVQRGQVLASQDIGVQEAELAGLEATLALRELQLARATKLVNERQVSQADYEAALAARDEAAALVRTRQAIIDRKQVYAPFDGVLGIRVADLGDYLEPGDPIVPLEMLDPIHVDYALPEQFLDRLAAGQPVEIEVPAHPGERFVGRISALAPGVDRATRTVRIRATFANPDYRLRPGMFARVWTVEATPRAVLTLPETAVTYSPYGSSVFVVLEGDGGATVERRQVETGEVRNGKVEVLSGLTAGARVVAVGQNKLRNGSAVSVTDEVVERVSEAAP